MSKVTQHRMLIQIPKEMHGRLVLASQQNERTVAAEIRFVVKTHLDDMGLPKEEEEEEEDDGAPV